MANKEKLMKCTMYVEEGNSLHKVLAVKEFNGHTVVATENGIYSSDVSIKDLQKVKVAPFKASVGSGNG